MAKSIRISPAAINDIIMNKQASLDAAPNIPVFLSGLVAKHDSFMRTVCGDMRARLGDSLNSSDMRGDNPRNSLKHDMVELVNRIEENTKHFTEAIMDVIGASQTTRRGSECSIVSNAKHATLNDPINCAKLTDADRGSLLNPQSKKSMGGTKNTLERLSTISQTERSYPSQPQREAFSLLLDRLSSRIDTMVCSTRIKDYGSMVDKLKFVENKIESLTETKVDKANSHPEAKVTL